MILFTPRSVHKECSASSSPGPPQAVKQWPFHGHAYSFTVQ